MACTFHLGNDPALNRPTVDLIQHNLSAIGTGDALDQMRIGIAFEEPCSMRSCTATWKSAPRKWRPCASGSATAVGDLLRQRQARTELRDRRIVVDVQISSHTARMVVRDDGRGFDFNKVSRAASTCFTDGWNRGTMLMTHADG